MVVVAVVVPASFRGHITISGVSFLVWNINIYHCMCFPARDMFFFVFLSISNRCFTRALEYFHVCA